MIDTILIQRPEGAFDVDEIGRYVESLPHTARDVTEPNTFMVTSDGDEEFDLQEAIAARAMDTSRFPFSVTLVKLHPAAITIATKVSYPAAVPTFFGWLRQRYPQLQITDEGFNDLTPYCTDNDDFLFE
ncbi:MAG: XRN 5'-3' exonuclease N-terminal domain-containing protein [Myxococcota bacterium]|nr:XRN 5'-3' exonuclease N-terminal domain-containing protein [Myxococcota bacterium]